MSTTLHIASPFSASFPVSESQGGAISSNASPSPAAGELIDDVAGPATPGRPLAPHILPPGASSAMDLVANIPAMTDGSTAPLKTVTEEYRLEAEAIAAAPADAAALTAPLSTAIQPRVA